MTTPAKRSRARVAVFTVVAGNYAAHARVLMRSLACWMPEADRFVVLVDDHPPHALGEMPAQLIRAADLGIPRFREMAFWYDVMELATAVKPPALRMLLRDYQQVIYLDPDICFFSPPEELLRLLRGRTSAVLTPHMEAPLDDGCSPGDLDIMKSGVFNLGFIGTRRSAETDRFLDWWGARCTDGAFSDVPNHLFTDQRWVDLAPAFLPSLRILRHPGYNLAYWNLKHRRLALAEPGCRVNGEPLVFFHFSGASPGDRARLSKHQDRISLADDPVLAGLVADYLDALVAAGWPEARLLPYGQGRFANGRAVHGLHRRAFFRLAKAGSWPEGVDPFAADSVFDLPRAEYQGLTPVAHELRLAREDLRATFPATPAGLAAYRGWFLGHGAEEAGLDRTSGQALGGGQRSLSGQAVTVAGYPAFSRLPASRVPEWLSAPEQLGFGRRRLMLPRVMTMLYQRRRDLQQAFPGTYPAAQLGLLRWFLMAGLPEGYPPASLLRPGALHAFTRPAGAALPGQPPEPLLGGVLGPLVAPSITHLAAAAVQERRLATAFLVLQTTLSRTDWPAELAGPWRDFFAAVEPAAADAVPTLLMALYLSRPDLMTLFDLEGPDGRLGLIGWALTHFAAEYPVVATALPAVLGELAARRSADGQPVAALALWHYRRDLRQRFDLRQPEGCTALHAWFIRQPAPGGAAAPPAATAPGLAAPALPGHARLAVSVVGHFGRPTGRSEDARMTLAALRQATSDIDAIPVDLDADTAPSTLASDLAIYHTNADTALEDYLKVWSLGLRPRRSIGYWAWELSRMPAEWHGAYSFYDEIWASSRFSEQAFRQPGLRPVRYAPMPVALPRQFLRTTRARFGLPAAAFLVLVMFDFGSYVSRKNPLCAIRAFAEAFPNDPDALLLVKAAGAERDPAHWRELQEAAAHDARIVLWNRVLDRAEVLSLLQEADVVLSPHRAEGFGRVLAEALLLRRALVCTGYSGNADFTTPETALLAEHSLRPVQPGEYLVHEGQVWAEPSATSVATLLRQVREDPEAARRLARQGRALVTQRYGLEPTGMAYRGLLLNVKHAA